MRNPFEIYSSSRPIRERKSLEWEESALDDQSKIEGFADEHRVAYAGHFLKALLILCCLVLGSRLFYLQILQGKAFRLRAEGNRIRDRVVLAPRGFIQDRNGEILAQNTASFNLIATPYDLPKEGLEDEVRRLASQLSLDKNDIWDKVNVADKISFQPFVVKQDLSESQNILFQTESHNFPGFTIDNIPIRKYADPLMFSHVIGYTGIVSDQELAESKQEYQPTDYIGKYGMELMYEKFLRGINGQNQVEVDASGTPIQQLGTIDPKSGNIAQLNIDKGLQEQIYRSFEKFSSKARGAAVAINPKNGEVLALISLPGFDNNLFAHGIKTTEYKQLLGDKNLPLFNRAIAGTYPPGSTAKLMVAAAALEEGVVKKDTIIVDRGVLVVPNQFNPGQNYLFRGWKPSGLGPVTLVSAISQSSDIYFYGVSGGLPNDSITGLGAEKLAEYYRKFNLGSITGVDLQGEKPGLVADPEWKMNYFKNDPILSKWYLGDTYHVGIGQGDMLTTPLQVAVWTATIANGGSSFKPRILQKIIDQNGKIIFEPVQEILVKEVASSENIKLVQEGMRQAVISGTARSLLSLPVSAAGKTGTSQFDGADLSRTHAWFTAYAPFEDPQIVLTVLVEAGGEGHAAAVPIVKDALAWWAKNRYKK